MNRFQTLWFLLVSLLNCRRWRQRFKVGTVQRLVALTGDDNPKRFVRRSVSEQASIAPTGSSCCDLAGYSALPIPSSGALASRVYTGTRTLGSLEGTIEDCDTIRGDFVGPTQIEAHVVGCSKTDGRACEDSETASLDESLAGAQRVVGARFTLVRVPEDMSCTALRALEFP